MASDSMNPLPSGSLSDLELLQVILHDSPYPWNSTDSQSDSYFTTIEQELDTLDWLTDELDTRGQALAATLDEFWASVPSTTASELVGAPQDSLFQEFAAQMPKNLVQQILDKARQVVATNLSLADQLVLCVQDVLPNWGEEDLQVFARPFAYAMRGAESEMLEGALRTVRYTAWTELSGVEQARLSLAIARYALARTSNSSHK